MLNNEDAINYLNTDPQAIIDAMNKKVWMNNIANTGYRWINGKAHVWDKDMQRWMAAHPLDGEWRSVNIYRSYLRDLKRYGTVNQPTGKEKPELTGQMVDDWFI